MTPQELKYSILQMAIHGKLVEQIKGEDTPNVLGLDIDDSPFDIPDTWKWQTLGYCSEMYTGNSISKSEKSTKYEGLEEGYDYIGTKDVSFEQKIEYDNGVRIPFDGKFKRAFKDSVLMCIEGGSAGRKIGILDRDVCFGNKLCMFRANKVLNTFLFYYLQSIEFRKLFKENMTGIIGGVSIKKLKEISIPLPPLAEQKRIVAKIEELLPHIDRYEESWSKLEDFNKHFPGDMQKSILQTAIQGKLVDQRPEEGTGEELYQQIQAEKQRLIKARAIKKEKVLQEITEDEKPFDIPENWKWVRLSSICKSIADGDHQAPPQVPSGVPFLVISNLSSGVIDFSNTRYVPQEYFGNLSPERVAENGDLIFTVTGSYGITVKVDSVEQFCFQRHMALLKTLMYNEYLFYLLKSPFVKEQCDSVATGTAQKTVGLNSLRNIVIPLPPLTEQERIVAKIKEILPLCEKLK